ncbi:CoA transferase [Streptomyces sp. 549]|uniref:CoA transferase n=1 Tax=Streptomyces sp. 549 TaxID=3049076 RepID=UPI0024C2EBC0|nr:CoA transferase [Streptomyces sp. 549]MDK1473159.1 CoA transferase [Streptomyces sp. 549]
MASPVTTRTEQPLASLTFTPSGPPQIMDVVTSQLRLLGADIADRDGQGEQPAAPPARIAGGGFEPVDVRATWSAPGSGLTDEATVQAATGVMAVHGRRDGTPRGLAADYAATATGLLTVQGLLAALLGQARGGPGCAVSTRADHAGLLTVSQYLAAAGAEEAEASEPAPGGPPFTAADGTLFELETLDPGVWARFWRALDAPAEAVRAGWRPFQFRYATACAPFPDALHETARRHPFGTVARAASEAGADVCRLRTLHERAAEHDGAAPLCLSLLRPAAPASGLTAPATGPGRPRRTGPGTARLPLAGLTVLEAGRRIQAPLAAHLLGLLGADVVRVEPPGGDPLRGMPPTCAGVSARWLALNRGKQAVEINIKDPGDRDRLRERAAAADVFLHNWAPGTAARLGLDADDLAAVNPALVHAYTGGWADRIGDAPMGTDFMVQARSGVGEAVRPDGEVPAPSLMTLLDVLGGLLGAQAVLAGLLLRQRRGHGVRVDSSLLGAADLLTGPALRRAARGDNPRRPAGFRRPLPTADGWVAPADACAARAASLDLASLPTGDALARLRDRGLAATPVTTDLNDLHHDRRFPGSISRDAYGAPAVPDPWSFA